VPGIHNFADKYDMSKAASVVSKATGTTVKGYTDTCGDFLRTVDRDTLNIALSGLHSINPL